MASLAIEARPYAKAVFDLANETGSVDAWSKNLAALQELVAMEEVHSLLRHPALTAQQRTEVLAAAMGDQADSVKGLLEALAENNRLEAVGEIAMQFEAFVAKSQKRATASVSTAFPLTDDQRQAITEMLKKKLECEVTIDESVDTALIGGAVIRVGDMLIDNSIAGRINKLGSALAR